MKPTQQQYLICTGNIADGFQFVGPFQHPQDAVDHATNMSFMTDEWHMVRTQTAGFTFILGDGCTNDHYVTFVADDSYGGALDEAKLRAVQAWQCGLEDIELIGSFYGQCVVAEWSQV